MDLPADRTQLIPNSPDGFRSEYGNMLGGICELIIANVIVGQMNWQTARELARTLIMAAQQGRLLPAKPDEGYSQERSVE